MKALLVTSEITYVPRNYQDLFEEVLAQAPEHIAGLVILRNFSVKLFRDALGLRLLGAPGVSDSLLSNSLGIFGRKREALFQKKGMPVLYAQSMNDAKIVEWVRSQQIDLVINVRTRCIYKKEILAAPRLGCLNIHHGLLPEYRGTLCDLYALSEGRPAGFTIHQMNEKIDAGRILIRKSVSEPNGEKDYIAYLARTGREEGQALVELLKAIAETDSLPAGLGNQCDRPVYTRNPDREKIRQMKREGMLL